MLLSIIILLLNIGTTNILIIQAIELSPITEKLIWLSFFLSFSVKIPMFPFHTWLPKAHVEAPTVGSVLLAGILLKLGCYGFLRFSIQLFPTATEYFKPFILWLAIISIIYSALACLRQIDMKRIVAYSSIAHMNLVILGCFSGNIIATQGAIMLMFAHAFVSCGLFICVGCL